MNYNKMTHEELLSIARSRAYRLRKQADDLHKAERSKKLPIKRGYETIRDLGYRPYAKNKYEKAAYLSPSKKHSRNELLSIVTKQEMIMNSKLTTVSRVNKVHENMMKQLASVPTDKTRSQMNKKEKERFETLQQRMKDEPDYATNYWKAYEQFKDVAMYTEFNSIETLELFKTKFEDLINPDKPLDHDKIQDRLQVMEVFGLEYNEESDIGKHILNEMKISYLPD